MPSWGLVVVFDVGLNSVSFAPTNQVHRILPKVSLEVPEGFIETYIECMDRSQQTFYTNIEEDDDDDDDFWNGEMPEVREIIYIEEKHAQRLLELFGELDTPFPAWSRFSYFPEKSCVVLQSRLLNIIKFEEFVIMETASHGHRVTPDSDSGEQAE